MKTYLTAFTLAAIAAQPILAFAEEFRSGERVEGTASFFMCGARDDLDTIKALERQGDKETARAMGTARCESGRPGFQYVVTRSEGDAVCIRREGAPYCLWAQRASLQVTPSQ